jgi:large subunit ribosomal protein L17e
VAKKYKVAGDKIAWPQKATKVYIGLLENIKGNAEAKGLDVEKCKVTHSQANQAPAMRRRTYRAHGRINAYESSPAHIQIIAEEAADEIVKEAEDDAAPKLSKKQMAQAAAKAKKVKVGE